MISVAAMGIDLLISWATGRSLDSTLGGIESKIKNPRKALEKAVKKICKKYNIEESSLKQKSEQELRSFLDEEQWIELSLEFLNELSKSDKEKRLSQILMKNRIDLESVKSRIEEMDLESLKTMMKSSTAAFSFYEVPSEKDLRNELGAFELEYIEREKIQVETLKEKERAIFVGKCGSGKSRLLFEVLKGKRNVVFVKSFFTVNDLIGLDMVLRPLNDFVIVWDNLHMFKEEEIRKCLQRISALCKEKGIGFYFFGGSRKENMYYGQSIEEISLSDMRKVQLVEACSERYKKKIDKKVSEMLLDAGDGTPEYIISFFRTFKKEEITEEDLRDPPSDVVDVWRRYIREMGIKGTDMEKVLRCVALSHRGFERVILRYVEVLYVHVFHGELSHFDDSLRSLEEMFFIEDVNEEEYSFHDSRAEAVEEVFPLKMRHVDRLTLTFSKLPEEIRKIMFQSYAAWSYFSEKYEFCVKFYDCIIRIDPVDISAYYIRGIAYSELNQLEKAIKDYDKAIELDPDLTPAYRDRSSAYFKLNQYEKAIENYNKVIELDPGDALAYRNRGIIYSSMNQLEKAIGDYNKAIELDPGDAKAFYIRGIVYSELNQLEKAIKDYDKAIELDPDLTPAYRDRSSAYFKLNQYEKAIEDYDKVIELDPGDALAYRNRGIIYSSMNQLEKAIEDYDKAIELDPGDAKAFYIRGNASSRLSQYEKAIENYNKAIELDPADATVHRNRGIVYSELNQLEKAIEDYDKAIELDPSDASAYHARGSVYSSMNQIEKAIEDYDKAIELDPSDASAYHARGSVYSSMNQIEKAIEDYDKAIELDPDLAPTYYNRGNAYSKLNQYEKAIENYNRAIELDPNYVLAYKNRGSAYSKLNQLEKAIEDYDKAIELDPGDALAYCNRGSTYSELNQLEKAIEDYDKAIELQEILSAKCARVYCSFGEEMEKIKNFEKAAHAFKTAGMIFFTSKEFRSFLVCISKGAYLIEHIQSDSVIYCVLILYLVTRDITIKNILQKITIRNRDLRTIFTIALKNEKDMRKDIQSFNRPIKSLDLTILLSLLMAPLKKSNEKP